MATKFVPVLAPEEVWDLWEAGLLHHVGTGHCGRPAPVVDKHWYIDAWSRSDLAKYGCYGYIEEA